MNLNISAHHINDILGNRKPQSGTLYSAFCNGLFPCKRIKCIFLEFVRHAHTIITDTEHIFCISGSAARFLADPDIDHSSCRSELYRITHHVQQHLVQTELICDNILMHHILCINIQILLFCNYISLHDRDQVMDNVRKMDFHFLQLHNAAFNSAHVQHIIDQAEQMLAGDVDLLQVLYDHFLIIHMRNSQCSIADHRIHRCTDVMRNTVEESGLCLIGILCHSQCIP